MSNNVKDALLELKNLAETKRRSEEFGFIKTMLIINLTIQALNYGRIILFSKDVKFNLISATVGFTLGMIIIVIGIFLIRAFKGSFIGIDFVENSKNAIIRDKYSNIISHIFEINSTLMKNDCFEKYIPYNREEFVEQLNSDWYKEFKDFIKDKYSSAYTTLTNHELKAIELSEEIKAVRAATRKSLKNIKA